MAECKDCIHFEICCEHWAYNSEGRTSADEYKRIMDSKIPCRSFKNKADVVEVDKVAEILRLSFGDNCACNFNGNDEWMWTQCKYAETDCPYPKEDNGCWKEFVKAMLAKMDGKGEGNGKTDTEP